MSHDKENSRATRVEIYASWLADDVDGLIHNIKPPFGVVAGTAILAEARAAVALALSRIDQAIATDREAHREKEPA